MLTIIHHMLSGVSTPVRLEDEKTAPEMPKRTAKQPDFHFPLGKMTVKGT